MDNVLRGEGFENGRKEHCYWIPHFCGMTLRTEAKSLDDWILHCGGRALKTDARNIATGFRIAAE